MQAKLAVESRAYPLFRYNPDLGKTPEECFELEGNPAIRSGAVADVQRSSIKRRWARPRR